MGQSLLYDLISKILSSRIVDANAVLSKHPIAHGLQLLEGNEWNADLVVAACSRVPPGFKVLGEMIEIIFLHGGQVDEGLKAVFVDRRSCRSIDPNLLKGGTKCVSRCSHGRICRRKS
jgi:hypothetical protein